MFGFFETYKLGQMTANVIMALLIGFAIIGVIATIVFFVKLAVRGSRGSKSNHTNKYM